MSGSRLWTLVRLDLTQRVRSVAWYVMLGVFAAILVVVTALSLLSFSYAGGAGAGAGVYSVVVFVVLLLAVLVSPTLSGNAINGDRDAANLAPVQVTLATTAEIVFAKFVAAWLTGLSFAVIAVPFMLVAAVSGGVDPLVVFVSLVVLIVEIAIIAAIGVGLSGILARPLFSVAVTYLVVAALVIGTPIAFTLGGAAVRTEVTQSYRSYVYDESGMTANPPECGPWETTTYEVPRFDTVWWILSANPFVILADATPARFDASGYPEDLFGNFSYLVRSAQIPPESERVSWDDCARMPQPQQQLTPEQLYNQTTPSWFVGLAVQLVLAAALLWWGGSRTRTPSRTLPPGTRIA